ncbi:MAG: hypothetical protein FJ161_02265 [Gammaproteobacteria bacterium]|nr:hypothetical protein [Gammaproteobacteria bacterium]
MKQIIINQLTECHGGQAKHVLGKIIVRTIEYVFDEWHRHRVKKKQKQEALSKQDHNEPIYTDPNADVV